MNRLIVLGVLLAILGIVGYVAGVFVEYPGRGFSVTAVMVGITLIALRRAGSGVGE